ncbi:MAG: DEAD/DEAH box helicase [Candidatus Micrarchaeia archaeon]
MQKKEFLEKGRGPRFADIDVDASIKQVMMQRGIKRFYRHQARGISLLRAGKNVVIVAPTGSGKTEIYMIPIVESALAGFRSLILYPTKALSRDQFFRFCEFSLLGVRCAVYDGDTPPHIRKKIREDFPHVLISNMDMLHHILMNLRLFKDFFRSLRYVVIDENHTYTGVEGAHAHYIIKRLKRAVAISGGKKPIFVCCSATVSNAKEFAELLVGEKFFEVDADGAPKGDVKHLMVHSDESHTSLSLKIAEELLKKVDKLLIFANSHGVVERLGMMARKKGLPLEPYRSGLSYERRRELESRFKYGSTRILATTSALELGVDIGNVDAVILDGFPGSITKMRQRIGRAGRKGQRTFAVFVPRDNPLDMYYFDNEGEYLGGEPESCFVNLENEYVREVQALAMARDYPLDEGEIDSKVLRSLIEKKLVRKFAGMWIPTREGLKELRNISIRGCGDRVRIYEGEKCIGDREKYMALIELFPGAIYMHGGEPYVSRRLDLDNNTAVVEKLYGEVKNYTVALRDKNAEILEELEASEDKKGTIHYGRIKVTDVVYGYIVRDYARELAISKHTLDEELVYEFETFGVWWDVPERIARIEDFGDGLHAVEHITIAMMPALAGSDPSELGGLSYPFGRMYIYESRSASGLAKLVYERLWKAMKMAQNRLEKCGCKDGCPKCILDPMCGNNNRFLSKSVAIKIIGMLFS